MRYNTIISYYKLNSPIHRRPCPYDVSKLLQNYVKLMVHVKTFNENKGMVFCNDFRY